MKSKKLIILISVVLVLVVTIVIIASVFAVRKVYLDYHNFDGSLTKLYGDEPTANDVLEFCKGKSIFFLSKDKLQTELNKKFTDWHVVGIVKNFPNSIDVHFVKRKLAAKIDIGGNTVYVDSFGYVMNTPEKTDCIDISSAFERRNVTVNSIGEQLQFVEAGNNERFNAVIEAIMAGWRCEIDLGYDMSVIFGTENVFAFDGDGCLLINMPSGAQVKVEEPNNELTDRLINAYGVYYNGTVNLQRPNVVITVKANGDIITSGSN